VPEISAQDLRRLNALETRLERAQDERRSLSEERRELRTRATAAERAAKAAAKGAADADGRLAAVLEENARLAGRLDELSADLERLRAAGTKLRDELSTARGELKQALAAGKTAERALGKADSERERLAERLKLAEAQVKTKNPAPVLPAREVAKLIDGFVEEVGLGLPGMVVRDGEIRLQVAFGKVGRVTGFVVPSADSPPDVRKSLHEVFVRFDRTLEGPEPAE